MQPSLVDVFDLDHTLIVGNASFRFGAYLFRKKVFNFFTLISLISYYGRHKFLGMPIQALHDKAFERLFRGRLCKQIASYVEAFLDEQLEGIWYLPALERLQNAQRCEHVTAIFSSSPDFLVEPIAKRLGVHHWRASRYSVNNRGCFQAVAQVLEGEGKATALNALVNELGLDMDAATVYSDSSLDLPFLRAGGKAIAVNPDKRLRALSVIEGWEVI